MPTTSTPRALTIDVIWVLIAIVVLALVAVVPRKRSWGPITYRRRSLMGGPVTGRLLGAVLLIVLTVLVVIALLR